MIDDSIKEIMQYFKYEHLPHHLQMISEPFSILADKINESIPDSYEKLNGLRKLLESKDSIVRASL